jgi:glucan phosphoethanolaminetransferase (alkaline phosphatase superfamily)
VELSLKTRTTQGMRAIIQLCKTDRSFQVLAVIVLLHLAISSLYIAVFATTFGFGRRLMLLHVLLVAGFVLIFLILFCLISGTAKLGLLTKRLLMSVSATLASSALILLYCLDFVSNHYWFESVSFGVIISNLIYLKTYLRAVNVNVNWVWLGLVLLISVLSSTYFILSKSTLTVFERLSRRGRNYLFADRRRIMQTIGGCVLLVTIYTGSLSFLIYVTPLRHREPILALVGANSLLSRRNVEVGVEQLRLRQQYAIHRDFNKRNVILITVDSLRADHMAVYGYQRETTPFLSRMVHEKKLQKVQLATANCPLTACAIPSILTSRNVDKLNPANIRIYDVLYDQGYRVNLILSGVHSSVGNLKESYGRSIDYYFDGKSSASFDPNDDRLLFEGLAHLPDYQGIPSFFYIHLMSTHVFGVRLSDYDNYQPALKETVDWLFPSYPPMTLANTYDNRVLQADGMIENLFSVLDQKGYLPNSIVIISADHGEGLGERGHFNHGKYLYQEDIHIPLLIYDPQLTSRHFEFATQIDIGPTLFDLLGLPIPGWWEGRSLLDPNPREYTYHQTHENYPVRAAVIHRSGASLYKYIYCDSREELYDLSYDPGETTNLINAAEPALLSRLRAALAEHMNLNR